MTEENKMMPENETSRVVELEDMNIETLRQALVTEKEKAEKNLACWQRAEADFSNYKKRTEQEKNDMINFANNILLFNLLPILDDFERAFASLSQELSEIPWIDGFRLIHQKLKATLEAQGLTEIKAVGQPFDPCLHESVSYQEGEEGVVIDEIQKGYKSNDKVLRATLAVVGKGKGEKAEEPDKI